jgi:hypothetical protein
MSDGSQESANDTVIRPFTVEIPDAELDSLRGRIGASHWPDRETVTDHSQVFSSRPFRNLRVFGQPSTTGAGAKQS